MIQIELEKDVEEFVQSKIRAGVFRDVSEAINLGLRLLLRKEQALMDAINVGVAETDAGLCVSFTAELVEGIKRRGKEQLHARRVGPVPR